MGTRQEEGKDSLRTGLLSLLWGYGAYQRLNYRFDYQQNINRNHDWPDDRGINRRLDRRNPEVELRCFRRESLLTREFSVFFISITNSEMSFFSVSIFSKFSSKLLVINPAISVILRSLLFICSFIFPVLILH